LLIDGRSGFQVYACIGRNPDRSIHVIGLEGQVREVSEVRPSLWIKAIVLCSMKR
jgi:hypothetical protein